jgi:hypothetical protein
MQFFDQLENILQNYDILRMLSLILIVMVVLFVYVVIITLQMKNLQRKYNILTRGIEKKSLDELLQQYIEKMDEVIMLQVRSEEDLEELKNLQNGSMQHIGIVRYSAYEDVGGDLSFSIAILDGDYSGVILTSIFGRNESRTYAKPIVRAESTYRLTVEEEEAVRRASLPRSMSRRGSKKNNNGGSLK